MRQKIFIALLSCAAAASVAAQQPTTAPATTTPPPIQRFSFGSYAAKFVCGVQSDRRLTSQVDAQAGHYSTKINVHNNTGQVVRFRKKFILLQGGEVPTPPTTIKWEVLQPDEAMEIVCRDIPFPPPPNAKVLVVIAPLNEGFVIIEPYYQIFDEQPPLPNDPLDVVGVYTYRGELPAGGSFPASDSGVSISVVNYPYKPNGHRIQ
jgi:hypothetical protein